METGTELVRKLVIPERYTPWLNLRQTQEAVKYIKDLFQAKLAEALGLMRVTAPLFVVGQKGVNDHLTGVERPVSFFIKAVGEQAEIVQSLAKWKRMALADYGFQRGEGLYTDMNAIRPDECLDNLHSIYVDQWDWERVIGPEDRNLAFLRWIVTRIYHVIVLTEREICARYPELPPPYLPDEICFVHSEELEAQYPDLTPRERECQFCREHGAAFVIGIGAKLANGKPHDERAADYDDWSTETGPNRRGLNGDILVWYPPLDCAMELSSMGIRVDPQALWRQLALHGEQAKAELYFHRRLLAGELPLSVGGGLGQSRLCMLFLRKVHIGEVQVGVWPEAMLQACRENGIPIL